MPLEEVFTIIKNSIALQEVQQHSTQFHGKLKESYTSFMIRWYKEAIRYTYL